MVCFNSSLTEEISAHRSEDNESILLQMSPFSKSSMACSCPRLEVLSVLAASFSGETGSAKREAFGQPVRAESVLAREDDIVG